MKVKSSELKCRARKSMEGHYGFGAGISAVLLGLICVLMVIYLVVQQLISIYLYAVVKVSAYSPQGQLIIFVTSMALTLIIFAPIFLLEVGGQKVFLDISRGKKPELMQLFYGFTHGILKFLGLYFLMILITLVMEIPYLIVTAAAAVTGFIPLMVVLMVIMIAVSMVAIMIVSLGIGQAIFLMIDEPDKGVFQCIRESWSMMRGNKRRLFYVQISFCGIMILGYTSLIGFLWVLPYVYCTYIHFYLDLKEKNSQTKETIGAGQEYGPYTSQSV